MGDFNSDVDRLQDRHVVERDWRNDSPLDVADDVRVAMAQAQEKADLDEAFEGFHKHSRVLGNADSADDLKRTAQWDALARQAPAQAVTALRLHYLQIPPRMHDAVNPPAAAKNEPTVVLTKAEKEEQRDRELRDVYSDVKRSIAEAAERQSHRENRARATDTLNQLGDMYGSNAPHILSSYVAIDKEMARDPVGNAPRLMQTIVQSNHELAGLAGAADEIAQFSKRDRQTSRDMANPAFRKEMSTELMKMPVGMQNSLEKAYAIAKEHQRGYWYRSDSAHRDDVEDDVRSHRDVKATLARR